MKSTSTEVTKSTHISIQKIIMECSYVSHLTDNQLIDLNNMYINRVQSTMDQLMKENEIFECVSESTYQQKRNKYITHVFFKASEMCNSYHSHNTIIWKMKVWKFKPSDEEMVYQICRFCDEMIMNQQPLNSTSSHDDIRSLYWRSQRLYQIVYQDQCMFKRPRLEDLNGPPACKKRKIKY